MYNKIKDGANIYIINKDNHQCIFDKCELKNEKVEMHYFAKNGSRWQLERLFYCEKCHTAYIREDAMKSLCEKYSHYDYSYIKNEIQVYENNEVYIPLFTYKIPHLVCKGVVRPYAKMERRDFYIKDLNKGYITIKLDYCKSCNNYFLIENANNYNFDDIKVIKEEKQEINPESFKVDNKKIEKNKSPKKKPEKIYTINENDTIDLIKKFEKRHAGHIYEKRKLSIMDHIFNSYYCVDCKRYWVGRKNYKDVVGNAHICNLIATEGFLKELENLNKTKVVSDSKQDSVINEKTLIDNNSRGEKIEFLIKGNTFRCDKRKHNIESITAVVDVFTRLGDNVEKEIEAFYCKNCKLYFIYSNQYDQLRRIGIPICPIYESSKYFSQSNGFESYQEESILRSFGYSVNATDDFTSSQRQKKIRFVIDNGILSKTQVMSHLNFLIETRSGQSKMYNAISKWKEDLNFTKGLDNVDKRKVKVGAFRTTKMINK